MNSRTGKSAGARCSLITANTATATATNVALLSLISHILLRFVSVPMLPFAKKGSNRKCTHVKKDSPQLQNALGCEVELAKQLFG
jgi:hypothetical protein